MVGDEFNAQTSRFILVHAISSVITLIDSVQTRETISQ